MSRCKRSGEEMENRTRNCENLRLANDSHPSLSLQCVTWDLTSREGMNGT